MYTLLIVDDEPLVRNAISTIIDWDSIGFTTIYQAEDGLRKMAKYLNFSLIWCM